MAEGAQQPQRRTEAAPRRISQLRIAESVAAALRDRIIGQAGHGNYQLPTQEQLMREFGVSHPSIREAIRILETEGLVTVRRGKVGGAEVHLPDQASAAYHLGLAMQAGQVDLTDLAEGIKLLEPQCAAACARREDRATAVVPLLRDAIARSCTLVDAEAEFTHCAREFHGLIVALAPIATLRYVVSALVALWSAQEESWAEMVSHRGEYPAPSDVKDVVIAHERIVDEIEAGRAEEAERLARAHLAAAQARLIGLLAGTVVNATSARAREAISATRTWLG